MLRVVWNPSSFDVYAKAYFKNPTQHTKLLSEEIKCSYLLILLSAIDTPDRRRRRGTCTPNLRVLVAVSSLLRLGRLPSREFEEYSLVIFFVVFVSSWRYFLTFPGWDFETQQRFWDEQRKERIKTSWSRRRKAWMLCDCGTVSVSSFLSSSRRNRRRLTSREREKAWRWWSRGCFVFRAS